MAWCPCPPRWPPPPWPRPILSVCFCAPAAALPLRVGPSECVCGGGTSPVSRAGRVCEWGVRTGRRRRLGKCSQRTPPHVASARQAAKPDSCSRAASFCGKANARSREAKCAVEQQRCAVRATATFCARACVRIRYRRFSIGLVNIFQHAQPRATHSSSGALHPPMPSAGRAPPPRLTSCLSLALNAACGT
jgi:hypothetical protein